MGDMPTSSPNVNDFATESVAWTESSCGITWEWWLQCWRHPTFTLLKSNGSGAYHRSSLWSCARWLWQRSLLHELRVTVLLGAVRRAPRLAEIVPTLHQFKMLGWHGWVRPAFTRFVSFVCQMQSAYDPKWAFRCGERAIRTDVSDAQGMSVLLSGVNITSIFRKNGSSQKPLQGLFHWSMNWTTRCVCNPWSMGYLDFATG